MLNATQNGMFCTRRIVSINHEANTQARSYQTWIRTIWDRLFSDLFCSFIIINSDEAPFVTALTHFFRKDNLAGSTWHWRKCNTKWNSEWQSDEKRLYNVKIPLNARRNRVTFLNPITEIEWTWDMQFQAPIADDKTVNTFKVTN
jgi:hypothetical protein